MKSIRFFFLVLFIPIFLVSCEDEPLPETVTFDANQSIAIPIGNIRFDLSKISNVTLPFSWFSDSLLLSFIPRFELTATMPFDGSNLFVDLSQIEKLEFHLGLYNEYPSDIDIRVYFLNRFNQVTDSLVFDKIAKANMNSNGALQDSSYSKKIFEFNQTRINNFSSATNIQVNLFLSKPNDYNLLKYYDNLAVILDLGLLTKISTSVK